MSVGLEGLLHLGGMAVLVGTGYIGIDRIRRDEARAFKKLLKDVADHVRKQLLKIDMMVDGAAVLDPWFDSIAEVHILCHIANIPVLLGGPDRTNLAPLGFKRRIENCWSRQSKVPALCYFRNRADRKVLGLLTFVSTILFFFASYGATWHTAWVETDAFAMTAFGFFTATILTVFVTAWLAYPILRIADVVEELMGKFKQQVQKLLMVRTNDGLVNFANGSEPLVNPSPQNQGGAGDNAPRWA